MTRTTRASVALAVATTLALPRVAFACVDDDECKNGRVCSDGQCVWPKHIDRYKAGDRVPAGYHVERAHRNGLLIAGGITLGVGLVLLLTGASASRRDEADGYVLVGTVLSLTGVSLFFGGVSTYPVLVRDDVRSASTTRTWGASVGLQF